MGKIIFLRNRIGYHQQDSRNAMRRIMCSFMVLWLLILNEGELRAGNIKVVRATKQEWSGGVEGLQGTRYDIEIALKKGGRDMLPVQVWIGNQCYNLQVSDSLHGALPVNLKVIPSRKSTTWKIFIEEDRSEKASSSGNRKMDGQNRSKPQEGKEKGPAYKGAALLIYRYGEKRCCLVINEFMALPALAYP